MLRPATPLLLIAILNATSSPLAAQAKTDRPPQNTAAAAAEHAALTITAADFRAKLDVIAHDSMRGREAPSPELERTTAWVAERFRAAGLQPAGDGGSFRQQFQLQRTRTDSLIATLSGPGHTSRWVHRRDFAAMRAPLSESRGLPLVLMAGAPVDTARPFGDVPVRGAAVLVVVRPDQLRSAILNPLAARAMSEGVAVLGVASEVPAELWDRINSAPLPDRWSLANAGAAVTGRTALYQVRLEALTELLRAAGEDPATLLSPEHQGVRALNGFTFSAALYETVLAQSPVANVLGIIEGSDPARRNEAVVFTGHMDHVGTVAGGRCQPARALPADSVCNGADDDASGTVGVVELAEAFASLQPRPARTLVFAAVTAEERGLVGSRYYVEHPVVPIEKTAAVVNLDMIARNPRDTVGLVGRYYSSLGALVDSTVARHPELRLTIAEHQGVYQASDHFPFAQRGVPALFFFSGEHPDLHTAADNPERADGEQAARVVRLAFYVGLETANAAERPVWEPEARARVVIR
ncbi:MAG: M20/M25/M40 family metallo-hydrolase [Gemmatimonadetes bacterium]|nr:M20/M25/M40 family metallo-hydrolase [Gemmatimonadota bacterium]